MEKRSLNEKIWQGTICGGEKKQGEGKEGREIRLMRLREEKDKPSLERSIKHTGNWKHPKQRRKTDYIEWGGVLTERQDL